MLRAMCVNSMNKDAAMSRMLLGLVMVSMFVVSNLQTISAQDTIMLEPNETFTGTVEGNSSVDFTVEIPRTQDVLIVAKSDGFIFVDRDVTAITAEGEVLELDYIPAGGGGSEAPYQHPSLFLGLLLWMMSLTEQKTNVGLSTFRLFVQWMMLLSIRSLPLLLTRRFSAMKNHWLSSQKGIFQ